MDFSFSDLNFNSVETLPGFEAPLQFLVRIQGGRGYCADYRRQ